jgi:hypothetical protein
LHPLASLHRATSMTCRRYDGKCAVLDGGHVENTSTGRSGCCAAMVTSETKAGCYFLTRMPTTVDAGVLVLKLARTAPVARSKRTTLDDW